MLRQHEAKKGLYKLLAAELEATRGIPPSDPNTGRAVGDACSGGEYIGRRSDGPVVSGSQPDEMAPGSYHMVFRDVRAASLPHGHKPFREEFHWPFNSYYHSLGEEIPEKSLRSVFSRPSLDEVLAFRTHSDPAMDRFLSGGIEEEATRGTVLGLNHEQQHQELALTDIGHAFF